MLNLPNTFGVFLVFEILAAPFGYEGATALMNRQWVRGTIAYLIALPLGAVGLMALGVPILGHDLTQAIRIFLTEWLLPLTSNPFLVVFLLTLVLTWLGGPRFVSRINSARWLVLFGVFFLCFSISMLL